MALSIADAQARQIVAAVYLRISKDEEGDREGVTRQLEDCLAECARHGWTPLVFEDNDVSAYSGKVRTAYRQMLDAIRYGTVGAVVAYHGGRLHRSVRETEDFLDLIEKTKIRVVTIRSGEYRWDTADGRAEIRMKAVWDRRESELMSERISRQRLQLAERGEPNPGGRRPFGFHRPGKRRRGEDGKILPCPTCGSLDLTGHCEPEAEKIRQAARDVIDGVSLRSVAADLGFTHTKTKQILTSERVAGLRKAGTKVVKAVWEPILPTEDWEVVRSILGLPQQTGAPRVRRHLLSGFLVCHACAEKLVAVKTQGVRRYRCENNHLLRKADPLEEYVTDRVLAALESPELAEALHAHDSSDVDVKAMSDEVARLEARLREAKRAWMVEGLISKKDFTDAKKEIDARLADVRAQLAARAGSRMAVDLPIGTPRIRRAWEKGDLVQRRELISIVVEKIVVKAAGRGVRRFDESTVEIHWRV
jgi:site-specific DNA recombinase